ncbi:Peroxin-3 [Massariosphaeria phaeospora]|uniref:Peroxin-3 n=1 Tax=Massariosphaeria phaeospora TaxID=100035 RepID=A0A7C8HZP2_9PLEO|nr:Peroxin-3 [Massariosphaeria phaeospora]
MISATRRWLRRNRTPLAVGAGVLGAGYVAGQYVLGKLSEARQRMSDERMTKDNLRRRFEQNQEDCSFTVLAILPTATENIVAALPVEQTLDELQKHKTARLARSGGASSAAPSVTATDVATTVDDDDGTRSRSRSRSPGAEGGRRTAGEGKSSHAAAAEGRSQDDAGKSDDGGSLASYVHASQLADEPTARSAPAPAPATTRTKAQLWREMKVEAITRAFTLLYTLALLTLLTRIQLNLLGRRNYLASVVSLAAVDAASISLENRDDDDDGGGSDQAYGNDFETNRRYLSLSWWLLHRGCLTLADEVRAAVKDVFGSLSPREEITLERLSELTLAVRKKVEGTTDEQRSTRKWLPYLLPRPEEEELVLQQSGMSVAPTTAAPVTKTLLRRLIDETSDLIDSPSFTHVLTRLLDAAFSHLIDVKMAQLAYKIPPVSESTARVVEIVGADAKAKVASSLAVFCRQAHSIGSGANNEYLAAIEQTRELQAFAAVVYSSNFEFESPERVRTPKSRHSNRTSLALGGGSLAAAPSQSGPAIEESWAGAQSGFESAWGKALAKEDGNK